MNNERKNLIQKLNKESLIDNVTKSTTQLRTMIKSLIKTNSPKST